MSWLIALLIVLVGIYLIAGLMVWGNGNDDGKNLYSYNSENRLWMVGFYNAGFKHGQGYPAREKKRQERAQRNQDLYEARKGMK